MQSVAPAMADRGTFAAFIIDGLSGGRRLEGFDSVFVALLRELAKGFPVPARALAEASGQPLDQVDAVLRQALDVEYDPVGNIIGYGITLRQTPHAFEVEGRSLYTWCALDTLMFPALIGKPARVNSLCPETGIPVSLTADPHELSAVEPAGAAVSLVAPQTDIRQSFCCQVHFFASRDAGDRWARRHPQVTVVSVEAAFLIGQEVARQIIDRAVTAPP